MSELQAMTVVQLRKLARENKVKLSAGIDKEGIVQRIAEALLRNDGNDAPETAGEERLTAEQNPADVREEAREEPAEQAQATAPVEDGAAKQLEKLQEAPLAADVTSVQPARSYPAWNQRPEEQDGYHPVYRQAWQARTLAQRENAPRPAWQQAQRPIGAAHRFGPKNAVPSAAQEAELPRENRETYRQPMQPAAQPPVQQATRPPVQQVMPIPPVQPTIPPPAQAQPPAYHEQPARMPDTTPKLDGYRLGYRAAPQRTPYQSRDGGQGGYQGGYRPNNYNPGYRPNTGYRPGNAYGATSYPQGGYPQRAADAHLGDGVYRMARDPQFAEQAESGQTPDLLKVAEGEPASGVLEILPDGYGFLRGGSLLPGKKDIYVSVAQIRRYDLRTGDLIAGKARAQRENDKFAALLTVETVNGQDAVENPERANFEQMIPVYPNKRISLESERYDASMVIRLVDLIAPIGFGQRAMIVSPPQSDGLSILSDISRSIKQNDKEAEVLMLLIDVAPEDVTEIRETADAEVFASTFADAPEMQTRVSETMLERAQRLVEEGRNVVILLDSLTKLTRAYQALLSQGGRPMNNTVTPAALVRPKRFFGAARNTREGGSLTVVATINVETGSRVDDIIFEEFKGTANMELFLLSPEQGDPIRPMIDLQRSGTKKDDMLLSEERKESLRSIRKVLGSTTNGEAVVQLIDMMKKTKCNEDLLSRLQDWVALWEKSGYLKR